MSILPLTIPISPASSEVGEDSFITPRRLAPYVLKAFLDAQRELRRCNLDDLCALYPVRRADLRRTVTALHHNDLLDAVRGRLTLRGFAVASALEHKCHVPIREAIRGPERSSQPPSSPPRELARAS